MITVKIPSNVALTPEYLRQIAFTLNQSIDDSNTLRIRKVDASGSLSLGDGLLIVDATAGAVTIDLLPAKQLNQKYIYIMKGDASANAVTIAPDGSETIGGASSLALNSQYDKVLLISDGLEFYTL